MDHAGLPPDQRIWTVDGYRPIADLQRGCQVISPRGWPRRILGLWVAHAATTLFRLQTTSGHLLRAMEGQRVLCRPGEGVPQWLPVSGIRPGDLVAVLGGVTIGGYGGRRPERRALPEATGEGAGVLVATEERTSVGHVDWVVVGEVDGVPYRGPVWTLSVATEHSLVSDGVVIADHGCLHA